MSLSVVETLSWTESGHGFVQYIVYGNYFSSQLLDSWGSRIKIRINDLYDIFNIEKGSESKC